MFQNNEITPEEIGLFQLYRKYINTGNKSILLVCILNQGTTKLQVMLENGLIHAYTSGNYHYCYIMLKILFNEIKDTEIKNYLCNQIIFQMPNIFVNVTTINQLSIQEVCHYFKKLIQYNLDIKIEVWINILESISNTNKIIDFLCYTIEQKLMHDIAFSKQEQQRIDNILTKLL